MAFDARRYAEAIFGAEQFANMFVVGVAFQMGALNLSDRVVEEAILLSGTAVDENIQAFRRGRQFVAAPGDLDRLVDAKMSESISPRLVPSTIVKAANGSELEHLVALRRLELMAYQNRRLATRYEELVERVRAVEVVLGLGAHGLSAAVAKYAYKLMAYKDEYEVARLARNASAMEEVAETFGEGARIKWQLHPPLLRAMGMKRKISLGRWFSPVFVLLYHLRGLRGTIFDPFGYAALRRSERQLIAEYEFTIDLCIGALGVDNIAEIVRLAELPDMIRGYEGVKVRSIASYRDERRKLLATIGIESTRLLRSGDGSRSIKQSLDSRP